MFTLLKCKIFLIRGINFLMKRILTLVLRSQRVKRGKKGSEKIIIKSKNNLNFYFFSSLRCFRKRGKRKTEKVSLTYKSRLNSKNNRMTFQLLIQQKGKRCFVDTRSDKTELHQHPQHSLFHSFPPLSFPTHHFTLLDISGCCIKNKTLV